MSARKTHRGAHSGNAGNGSKWIRREKRLRIYARDHWRCVWCEALVIDGTTMREALQRGAQPSERLATLDHFLPRGKGGDNSAGNLLTACMQCNESRGDKPTLIWANELAAASSCRTLVQVAHARTQILERCLRALAAPLLTLEERSAA